MYADFVIRVQGTETSLGTIDDFVKTQFWNYNQALVNGRINRIPFQGKNIVGSQDDPWKATQDVFFESSIELDILKWFGRRKCNGETELKAINIPLWIKRLWLETLISKHSKQINTCNVHKVADVSMRPLQCHTHNNKSKRGPWFPISQECVSHFTVLDLLTVHLLLWTTIRKDSVSENSHCGMWGLSEF